VQFGPESLDLYAEFEGFASPVRAAQLLVSGIGKNVIFMWYGLFCISV
jgi:hypothetical protein